MHKPSSITPPTSPPQTPSPQSSSLLESPNSPSMYSPPTHITKKPNQWLQANLSLWSHPNARSIGVSIDDEEVTCNIDMRLLPQPKISHIIDPLADDPFTENIINECYILILVIMMPPSSIGPLVWHRTSPPIILNHYSSKKSCLLVPDWCRSMDIGQTR
ncbi:hypothetical protein BDN71DRAFT_1514778 [Pleurotus eryngii]|uniref:Uncharacterized protein n=1 Tax=Pleurotus eryngii TaxID=5323 RepID=A0A9P6CZP0_PLEER|nr:hypothetical protein BDN71DRAFT_1514778 [Pleurotus eryngii]